MILHIIDQNQTTHTLEGEVGWRLMEVIRDYDLDIKAECGGACACATCHVYVADAWLSKLPPMRDDEQDRLAEDAFAVTPHSRLSCQIILTDEMAGLTVTLAPGISKNDL
jgi:2Fe-2S ferredoxin